MTKIITLIILLLLAVACGGDTFGNAVELSQVGGSAGASGVAGAPAAGALSASGGGAHDGHGGMPSIGGSSAGAAGSPTGGTTTGGAASGGSGGAPAMCEFDPAQLTAALPKSLVWNDFIYTEGALCVTCRDKPCSTIKVISWGVPTLLSTGEYQYLPNAEMPMISMNFGTNDGMCTKSTECGIKVGVYRLEVTVVQDSSVWLLTKATVAASAIGNQCITSAGFMNPYPAEADLEAKISTSLTGLKIPCKIGP